MRLVVRGDGRTHHDRGLAPLPADEPPVADHLVGCARPLHPAGHEPDHPVGEPEHLLERVAHVDHRNREARRDLGDAGEDLAPADLVEPGEGLVHEEEPRTGEKRARDRHALALAPREIPGPPPEERLETQPLHSLGEGEARAARPPHRVLEVPAHAEVGEEARFLEDVAHPAAMGRDEDAGPVTLPGLLPADETPAGPRLETGHAPEERRLSRARGTEDGRDPLTGDRGVEVEEEAPQPEAETRPEVRHGVLPPPVRLDP